MIDQTSAASSRDLNYTDTPDTVTVLRAANGLPQNKTYRGWQPAERSTLARLWRVTEVEVNDGLDGLLPVIERVAALGDAVIVRALPRAELDLTLPIRRLSHVGKDGAAPTLVAGDHHWFQVDLDKIDAPACLDLQDRATWNEAARVIIERELPERFHGVSCIAVWSSSAGWVSGVVGCHLWFWSSRAVSSASLHAWATPLRFCDVALFVDAHPHSVAPPVFLDGARSPVKGSRVWRVAGRPFVELPPEVVDCHAWEEALAVEGARREAERLARASAMKASGLGDCDADYDEAVLASALEVLGCDDRADWIKYGQALHAWSSAKGGDGWSIFERWSQGSAKFNAGNLAVVWRSFGAERGRGAGSIIHAARAAGWRSPGEIKRDETARRVKVGVVKAWLKDKEGFEMSEQVSVNVVQAAPVAADPALPESLGDLLAVSAAPTLSPVAPAMAHEPELLTVDECRAAVRDVMADALERGGVTMVRAPAGIGKTRVMIEHVVGMARAEAGARFAIVVPTHALAAELVHAYRRAAPDIWIEEATVRDEHSCFEHDLLTACGRVGAELARRACLDCELHPTNQGGEPACDFMRNRGGRGAQIQIMTHALWSMSAEHIDDDFLPDVVVVDESVWSSCVLTDALTPGHLAELIGQQALITRELLPGGEPPTDALLRLCQRSLEEGRRIGSEVLAEVIGDAIGVEDDEEYAASVYAQARGKKNHSATMARLAEAPSWKGRRGLRECVARNWQGSYIQHGQLHVGDVEPFPVTAHRAVIALDATATRDTARAFFGDDCEFEELNIKLPEHVELIKVHADLGPASHIGPGQDESRINQARLGALLMRYASHPGALAVVMKSWLTEGSTSAAIIKAASEQAHVIWHNGIDARGSNAYRLCDTVVVTHYRVPRGVSIQAGELLAHALGEEHEVGIWTGVARLQLEAAPLAQAAARIRFLDANEDHHKRVIFAAPADVGFQLLGLGAEQLEVEADELLWEELSIPTPSRLPEVVELLTSTVGVIAPTRLARDMTGALPWRDVLPEVGLRGRAVLAAIDGKTEPEIRSAYKNPADLISGSVVSNINGIGESAGRWVFHQVKNHWGSDWSLAGLLKQHHVRTAEVEVRGLGLNKPLPVWVPESVRGVELIRQLDAWAALAGADAWRLPGEPAWRNVHRVEVTLLNALAVVPCELEPADAAVTMRAFFEAVCEGMPAADGWTWRRVERAITRTCPEGLPLREHLSAEVFKARAIMHAQLVENEEESAHIETVHAAEAAGLDPVAADHMPALWERLDSIGWLLSADLDRPLIPRRTIVVE